MSQRGSTSISLLLAMMRKLSMSILGILQSTTQDCGYSHIIHSGNLNSNYIKFNLSSLVTTATLPVLRSNRWLVATILVSAATEHFHHCRRFHWTVLNHSTSKRTKNCLKDQSIKPYKDIYMSLPPFYLQLARHEGIYCELWYKTQQEPVP